MQGLCPEGQEDPSKGPRRVCRQRRETPRESGALAKGPGPAAALSTDRRPGHRQTSRNTPSVTQGEPSGGKRMALAAPARDLRSRLSPVCAQTQRPPDRREMPRRPAPCQHCSITSPCPLRTAGAASLLSETGHMGLGLPTQTEERAFCALRWLLGAGS